MIQLLISALVLVLSFIAAESIGLFLNVRAAKATGLPYTISPYLEFETIAYITTPTCILRYAFRNRLMQGKGWPRWARFMIKDWPYEDKSSLSCLPSTLVAQSHSSADLD